VFVLIERSNPMFFDVFSGFLGALKTTFQNIYFENSYILDFLLF